MRGETQRAQMRIEDEDDDDDENEDEDEGRLGRAPHC
jgi:hypothetical protein